MKESVLKRMDLMNLTRWATVFIVVLLLAAPHLREQEREAEAVAFESSGMISHGPESEAAMGAAPQGEQGNMSEQLGQVLKDTYIDPPVDVLSSSGIPGPVAPIEDTALPETKELTSQPVEASAASLRHTERPETGSGGKIGSGDKEKGASPYDPIIHRVAKRYQVDPALVKAIIMAESSYNPKAVSRKGARGLMQLMPRTARALGVENIFDPEDNIDAGVRYFKQLLEQFDGDMNLAIAAYNAGSRKVRMYKGIPPFKHTRYYVAKVIEYHRRYQQ